MVKKIILSICLLCCSVFLIPSFDSKASSGKEFHVNYAEPSANDTQGYLTLLLEKDGVYSTSTLFWYCSGEYANSSSADVYACLDIDWNSVEFYLGGSSNVDAAYHSLYYIDTGGNYETLAHSYSEDYTLEFSDYVVRGWKIKGNVGLVESQLDFNEEFSVYYSSEANAVQLKSMYDKLHQVYNRLTNIYQNDLEVLEKLEEIWYSTTRIDSILCQLLEYQMQLLETQQQVLEQEFEQTGLLDRILQWLEESKEKEKEEASIQGGSSVSQGNSAIEDKGAGFSTSLGNLTSSMSYTGTQCAWEFPTVKLPAIPGVMDEVTLIKSQPIDFAQWINVIPSNILLIVQSVCTIGLIVYCFKELYNTIAYVLTLRKDDNS